MELPTWKGAYCPRRVNPLSVRLFNHARGAKKGQACTNNELWLVDHMDSFSESGKLVVQSHPCKHQEIFLMNESVIILRGLGKNRVSYSGLKFCRFEMKLQVMWIIGTSCHYFFVSVHLQCYPDRPYPEMCRSFWTVTETIQSLKIKTKFGTHKIGNSTRKRL